jgi:hypothetical protein
MPLVISQVMPFFFLDASKLYSAVLFYFLDFYNVRGWLFTEFLNGFVM